MSVFHIHLAWRRSDLAGICEILDLLVAFKLIYNFEDIQGGKVGWRT